MTLTSDVILPYAPAILKLLRDVLYAEDKEWELLLSYHTAVAHYFAQIGLLLHLDEAEGFAYLSQPDPDPDDPEATTLPRLVSRLPLTYEATLLAVLLREALQQFDANRPDESRFILSRAEMQEMLMLFFSEQNDMTRLLKKMDSVINQVERVGFVKRVGKKEAESYEVKRIIKAKISADKLVEIRDELASHLDDGDAEEDADADT
ncbi:MAG: DUF4194 domain-containing protein [Anaerolineales bacterium]|nr:DUF4194 domain-containing protein [Anaerolineales bacterium]